MAKDKILTIKEVADRFQVQPRTIYRWIESGSINPPEKIGGSTRWRESTLLYTPKKFIPGKKKGKKNDKTRTIQI